MGTCIFSHVPDIFHVMVLLLDISKTHTIESSFNVLCYGPWILHFYEFEIFTILGSFSVMLNAYIIESSCNVFYYNAQIDTMHYLSTWTLSQYYLNYWLYPVGKFLQCNFVDNLFTGLFQLVHKFISTATMSSAHYKFHGTLPVTLIWESFLLIQFSGIIIFDQNYLGSATIT